MALDTGGGFCSPREQNATEWSERRSHKKSCCHGLHFHHYARRCAARKRLSHVWCWCRMRAQQRSASRCSDMSISIICIVVQNVSVCATFDTHPTQQTIESWNGEVLKRELEHVRTTQELTVFRQLSHEIWRCSVLSQKSAVRLCFNVHTIVEDKLCIWKGSSKQRQPAVSNLLEATNLDGGCGRDGPWFKTSNPCAHGVRKCALQV